MIVIVYGNADTAIGKTSFCSEAYIENKVVIEEAHKLDFENYKFKKNYNYFLIVDDLFSLPRNILEIAVDIVNCTLFEDSFFGYSYYRMKKCVCCGNVTYFNIKHLCKCGGVYSYF
jgi:hypothetical protein